MASKISVKAEISPSDKSFQASDCSKPKWKFKENKNFCQMMKSMQSHNRGFRLYNHKVHLYVVLYWNRVQKFYSSMPF